MSDWLAAFRRQWPYALPLGIAIGLLSAHANALATFAIGVAGFLAVGWLQDRRTAKRRRRNPD